MNCPQCDGPGLPLGALGTTQWFRCQDCGAQFSQEATMTTVYIVPATSDIAGQCNIVARPGRITNARDDYRANPERWVEVGLMASDGHVRCIEPQYADIEQDQPLAAGLQFFVLELN